MPLMTSRAWKHPKSGVYWFRKVVPAELRSVVGKREEKFSLGTKDPTLAKQRHLEASVAVDQRWARLREKPERLKPDEANRIAQRVYDGMIEHFRAEPHSQTFWDLTLGAELWNSRPEAKYDPTAPLSDFIVGSREPSPIKRREMERWCREQAESYAKNSSHALGADDLFLLSRSISSAMQSACTAIKALEPYDFAARGKLPGLMPRPAETRATTTLVLFEQLIQGWEAEKRPREKTRYMWSRVMDQLAEFVGHRDAGRLSSDDVLRWKAALITSGLKVKTVRDSKLAPVRAILQWGVDNQVLNGNPCERVSVAVKARAGERIRSFTDEEAQIVLRAAAQALDPVRRWVPWICAYSGARLSEVCQLRFEDVFQAGEMWCFRFVAEAGELKTEGSERTIPIHPALIQSGILKFVADVGAGPLFARLTPDRFGNRGGNGTKLLSRWVRKLGLTDAQLSPSHSWRHRLKTLGRRHGLAPDIVDSITGHGKRNVGDAYGEYEVSAMLRELAKIPAIETTMNSNRRIVEDAGAVPRQ